MKKVYSKPEIAQEHGLEQTSLACNTTNLNLDNSGCFDLTNMLAGYGGGGEGNCAENVAKNGAYTDEVYCNPQIRDYQDIAQLS